MSDEMKSTSLPKIDLGGNLDALTSDALEQIKADPLVYPVIHDELKLSTSQVKLALATLLDYQEDVHYCASCPGYETCAKTMRHKSMRLTYEDGLVDRRYAPCELAAQIEALRGKFLYRDYPSEWMGCSFEKDADMSGKRRPAALALAEILSDAKNPKWVYLCGSMSSGRTFLAASFANSFAETHDLVAFCHTPNLCEKLKDLSINNRVSFAEEMRKLESCDLLVLDDFGNENASKYVLSMILLPLLLERAKNGLPVIFTSDFSLDEIASLYRATAEYARVKQLKMLLESQCGTAYDISALPGLYQ